LEDVNLLANKLQLAAKSKLKIYKLNKPQQIFSALTLITCLCVCKITLLTPKTYFIVELNSKKLDSYPAFSVSRM